MGHGRGGKAMGMASGFMVQVPLWAGPYAYSI